MQPNNSPAISPAHTWSRLSSYMAELLMDIHERELLKLPPYEASTTRYAKGLIERGMLLCNYYITASGKNIVALYLTEAGRRYLNQIK